MIEQKNRQQARLLWLLLLFVALAAYAIPKIGLRGECLSYENFKMIKEGMTRGDVVRMLGDPNWIEIEFESIPTLIPDEAADIFHEVLVYHSPGKTVSARVTLWPDESVREVMFPHPSETQ